MVEVKKGDIIPGRLICLKQKLKEKIGIKELEVLNEQKIPADVRALTEHYLNKGYTNVKVSYSLEKEEDGDVIVVFNISEGKSVIVTEINFEGNNPHVN